MIIKKGKFYYFYIENEEVSFEINNWITPFGLEEYGKKTIVNLIVPNNNEGFNLKNILYQIREEINSELNEIAKLPIRDTSSNTLLRCEIKQDLLLEKKTDMSGTLFFKIYNFKGNYGVSVVLEVK